MSSKEGSGSTAYADRRNRKVVLMRGDGGGAALETSRSPTSLAGSHDDVRLTHRSVRERESSASNLEQGSLVLS